MLSKTNWFKGKTVVEPPAAAPTSQNKEKVIPSNPQESDQSESNYDAHTDAQRGGNKETSSSHQGGRDYDATNSSHDITSPQGEEKTRRSSINKKRRKLI